jgi:glycosidase
MAEGNGFYPEWLDDAVFYEIYPQSFCDSNGDGIGDIPGIISKLDYLVSLGVNAVWLNPCFVSPFLDAGYDVADYYQVAPRYGTNDDLRRLFAEARAKGIHIFVDLVPGHTSWDHPWFKASAMDERNEYSDWYIWTNNVWQPADGLTAISGLFERDGAYVTNFFVHQPALNYGFAAPDPAQPWQEPVDAPGPRAARQEIRNIMKFWLDAGASGFRVDMAASLVKRDLGHRETIRFWQGVRSWLDVEYPEAALVSEWGMPHESLAAGFHMDFMLHFAMPGYTSLFRKSAEHGHWTNRYGWSFFDESGHGNIREFMDEYEYLYNQTHHQGLICIPTGNHDMNPRLGEGRSTAELLCAFTFILTMPGVPFIYYGDEIGMRTVQGLPSKEGGYYRTGSRTPMQWDDGPNAGFSTAPAEQLYLPIDPSPDRPTVAAQMASPDSLLNQVRELIAMRKTHGALCAGGTFRPLYAEAGRLPFVYERGDGGERVVVSINPAAYPVEVTLPAELAAEIPVTLSGPDSVFTHTGAGWVLHMPPVSAGVYRTA